MKFVGRDTELQFLTQHYEKEGSHIVVVYGQKGVGKTALLAAFGEGKNSIYYLARACSEREQRNQWAQEIRNLEKEISDFPEYGEIFHCLVDAGAEGKCVLVVDEFHHILKNDTDFFQRLIVFLRQLQTEIMVVLCSSAAGWVENNMVEKIGSEAGSISGFLKVRELGLDKIQEIFSGYSEDDAVQLYSVLGGVPGLWCSLDSDIDASGNLIHCVLNKYSRIYGEMSLCLVEELREPAVYNTILAAMASGCDKLNDIYHRTGFSRAKISVYLKNLMELDLVEKVGSGIYRITRPSVRFYFRFLFPNQSRLEELSSERFFAEVIEDAFPGFVREAYRRN